MNPREDFYVEYTYGPFVGRRHIQGPTFKAATESLWDELGRTLWVAKRFRLIKEIKE